MKSVSLSGSLRENVGKKDAKKQRREGRIPCVIYGGEEQIHCSIEELAFDAIIFTPDVFVVNLTVDDNEYQVILQDVQYHPVSDKVLHADFLQILDGKPFIVGLPVRLVGVAEGVAKGGKLIHKMHKLFVKGLVNDIPDYVEIDVTSMDIGGSVKVITAMIDKLTFLDPPNAVIARVKAARNMEEEIEDEDGDEVEEGAEAAPETEAPAAE